MIKNCTILLFTCNRYFLLKKNIKYYQLYFSKIIVLDSSDNFIFLDKNIKHIYLPKISFLKRLLIGIKKCTTKYFLIVPDDDFIIPHSVEKAIKFLKKNKDFVTVSGNFYYFEKCLNLIKYKKINTYKYKLINKNSFFERLNSLKKGHSQMVYCIFKKNIFAKPFFKFMKFYNEKRFSSLAETIITLLCIFSGKHKYINSTWMVRDGKNYNSLPKKRLINFLRKEQQIIQHRFFFKKNLKFLTNIFYNLDQTNKNLIKKRQLNDLLKAYFFSIRNTTKLLKKNYFLYMLLLPKFKFLFKYFYYIFFHFFRRMIFKNRDENYINSIEKIVI